MSAAARPAVAFLGLGRMGRPMARRVAQAGFPLAVWNRTVRTDAVPDGARLAATARDAADGADVVMTMVADAAALTAVLEGPDGVLAGARAGSVLVDMSTVGPAAARAVGRRCADAGVALPVGEAVRSQLQRAQDAGLGARDLATVLSTYG